MIYKPYYIKLVKHDFILKDVTTTYKEVPEIDKLELVIYYPKVVDDYDMIMDGVIFIEELSGQFPNYKMLSTKRTGASDYESNYIVKTSLRDEELYNFFYFLHIALLFLWTQRRMILSFPKKRLDKQTKVIKLYKNDFFYLFNMPLLYDERRDPWNFQIHVYMKNSTINVPLLSSMLSCFFIYDILNMKKKRSFFPIKTLPLQLNKR